MAGCGPGQPGEKYENTRHNVGFHRGRAGRAGPGARAEAEAPRPYQHLGGGERQGAGHEASDLYEPVRRGGGEAARFYKLPPERVLVISDDVSLPVGKLRIRKGGSAGGHNGLKSIIQHLGTDQFPRIKVGVGQKPHPDYDMADWVLSKFAGEDLKTITEAIRKAADAVECLIQEGPDKAMNRFNG